MFKEVGEHSDSDQHHDSDKDPDYNIGYCEVVKFGLPVKILIAKFCCVLNFLYTITRRVKTTEKNEKPKRLKWKEVDRNRTWLKIRKNSC